MFKEAPGRKFVYAVILTAVGMSTHCYSQFQPIKQDSTLRKYSYLKFSLFPYFYGALVQDALRLTFQYEFQLNHNRRTTYSAVVDYHSWTYKLILNGVPVSVISGNVELYFRPQIRFYIGKNVFNGFYLGLFPLWLYRDLPSYQTKGIYLGVGAIGGYQFFVRKKIPLEINIWTAWQTGGNVSKVDPWGNQTHGRDSYGIASFEFNIGLPIKRRK